MATFKVTFVNGATQIFVRDDFDIETIAREVFGRSPKEVVELGAKIEDTETRVAPIKITKKKGE